MIFADRAPENELEVPSELLRTATSVDEFECYRAPHSSRIALMADALAVRFRFALRDRVALRQAAYFHDAGEAAMGREYISARRTLTSAERLDLMRHPVIGEQQAAKSSLPRAVQLLVRWHHEWWNGSGYPDRIEGARIPVGARILRICDTYAALTSERPYRRAFSLEEADRYIAEAAGIEFDPEISLAMLSVSEREFREAEVSVREVSMEEFEAAATEETDQEVKL